VCWDATDVGLQVGEEGPDDVRADLCSGPLDVGWPPELDSCSPPLLEVVHPALARKTVREPARIFLYSSKFQ